MIVRLSERDFKILAKCAAAKWLTTGQLRRLYFPGVTADAVCKCLRRLSNAGYLTSTRPHRMAEALRTVGPKGKRALGLKGIEIALSRTLPRQVEHMIGINEVRVGLESEPDRVAYFFAHWELGKVGWAYPVIPDAIFELKCPGRRRFALEFDRGTEPFEVLRRKLYAYEAAWPGFLLRALVLVTETHGRLRTIQRHFANRAPPVPVLGASLADIRSSDLCVAPAFRDLRAPDQPAMSLCARASDVGAE